MALSFAGTGVFARERSCHLRQQDAVHTALCLRQEDSHGWPGRSGTSLLSLRDLQPQSMDVVERGGEPAEEQTPPSPPRHSCDPIVSVPLVPHLSQCQLLLGPWDPQRLLHVSPHLSLQAAALMCLTVLFVILQSRVLILRSKGKESQAQNRTGTEIGTRRNLEEV